MELEPSGVKVEKEMTVVTLPYMANSTNRQNVIHDIILLSERILVTTVSREKSPNEFALKAGIE